MGTTGGELFKISLNKPTVEYPGGFEIFVIDMAFLRFVEKLLSNFPGR